jgi:alkaline phosphatase D
MTTNAEKYVQLNTLSEHGEVRDEANIEISSSPLHSQDSLLIQESNISHPNATPASADSPEDSIKRFIKEYATLVIIAIVIVLFFSLVDFQGGSIDDYESIVSSSLIRKIGFGSCTSYDMRDMTIWRDAIIPAEIDAWIWAGDFVYLDDNNVNCQAYEDKYAVTDSTIWQSSCNCTPSWLQIPPFSCRAGDLDFAQERWLTAVSDEYYNEFLEYMCPIAMEAGIFPPPGQDPSMCSKPIYGIYDDHDFGSNDMNHRLPHKAQYKEMYLDAIGESRDSIRRNDDRGAWLKYTLNDEMVSSESKVDLFLLDERYERDSLPCDTMRDACERMVIPDTSGVYSRLKAWCYDFLYGKTSEPGKQASEDYLGTCCSLDEDIFWGWCQQEASKTSTYYQEACNTSYIGFGHRSLVLDPDSKEIRLPREDDPVDTNKHSPFCDVLGMEQRRWLRHTLSTSDAAVKLVVSGSVLLHYPLPYSCGKASTSEDVKCRCSGDDWDCYSVAQRELLHLLSQTSGCVIVLTGDFHFSDIKVLNPGSSKKYASVYNSASNPKPIYQVMASGMSYSTGQNYTCSDFRLDPLQLRTHPECSFVTGPNFGMVHCATLHSVVYHIADLLYVSRLKSAITRLT